MRISHTVSHSWHLIQLSSSFTQKDLQKLFHKLQPFTIPKQFHNEKSNLPCFPLLQFVTSPKNNIPNAHPPHHCRTRLNHMCWINVWSDTDHASGGEIKSNEWLKAYLNDFLMVRSNPLSTIQEINLLSSYFWFY